MYQPLAAASLLQTLAKPDTEATEGHGGSYTVVNGVRERTAFTADANVSRKAPLTDADGVVVDVADPLSDASTGTA